MFFQVFQPRSNKKIFFSSFSSPYLKKGHFSSFSSPASYPAKEALFRCKEKCIFSGPTCEVINLKECSMCHNVLKSRCTKSLCQGENGEKPAMLLPAAATAGLSSWNKLKLHLDEESGESEDESECFLESESSNEDSETYEKMVDDELADAVS